MDQKTKLVRELFDQLIVGQVEVDLEKHDEPFRTHFKKNLILLSDIE